MSCPHTDASPRFFVPDAAGGFRPSHLMEWAAWYEANRQMQPFAGGGHVVHRDEIGAVVVSTVFLGLDQSMIGGGPPILFETMIFGGDQDGYRDQYATLAEAEAGHREVLKIANGS